MDFSNYNVQAMRTARFDRDRGISYNALKLSGEAGEINDKLGKGLMSGAFTIYDNLEAIDASLKVAVIKEMGDALWHLNALAVCLDTDLDRVARDNIHKLTARDMRNAILGEGDDR